MVADISLGNFASELGIDLDEIRAEIQSGLDSTRQGGAAGVDGADG